MVVNLTNPEFLANPDPFLADMRAQGPLVRAQMPMIGKIWVTTTDAATRALLKDSTNFSRDTLRAKGKPIDKVYWWMPRSARPLIENIVVKDEPDHTRLRKLVDQAFARSAIEDLKPAIAAIADELLDQLDPTQPTDIIRSYSRELPFQVICELLGIPASKRPLFARRLKPITAISNPIRAAHAMFGLKHVMRDLRAEFDAVRTTPRPGLITDLVHAENNGDRLSEDELVAMVFALFVAGHDTTVHLINNLILAVLTNPDLRASISGGASPLLIEEIMRHASPVIMSTAHYALHDHTFQGVDLKKGEVVSALLLAANRDPDRFEAPNTLISDRRPNAHLGFGHGPHVCLGMQLARAEAAIALDRLFTRFPNATLTNSETGWIKRAGMRGPAQLRIGLNG